jgi:AAA15 family ATPase/GTPase
MFISKLKIKNFKCFDEVEIKFDPNFNLIIGENNSGKSTIFDALRLWQLAFQKFLKDRTNNQQSSFYASQFYSFTIDDISFLRIIDFKNLFRNNSKKDFEISLSISDGHNEVNLPILFLKTTKGQVLNFQLCKHPNQRPGASQKLSELFDIPLGSDFKELFLFTYINPIFLLLNKEPLYSKGYILNKLHKARANEIIRNLLFTISPERKKIKKEPKTDKLIHIEESLKSILQIQNISFSKRLEDEDSFIKIFSKNEDLNTEVEINQLGSGTINVLNILSVLAYGDYEKFGLNALLLDEPDSHLHFNHQSRLYEHLKGVSYDENKQIFIITHNSTLISQFDNVLFIKKGIKQINPITLKAYLENELKLIDENHFNVMKELNDAKKEKEIYEKQLNEIRNLNVPLVFTEGSSDVLILENAFKMLYPDENCSFQIVNGYSSSQLKNIFENKETFEKNNNPQIAIFDFDSAYNQWNGLWNGKQKEFTIFEEDPLRALSKKHSNFNAYAILLPVPNILGLQNQVLDPDDSKKNFGDKSILQIEHLFYDVPSLRDSFEEKNVAGGKCICFKGSKSSFAEKTSTLSKEDFKHFIPLFEKIAVIIGLRLPKVEFNA